MTHGIKKIFEAMRKAVLLFHEIQTRKQNGILFRENHNKSFFLFFKALKADVLKVTYKNKYINRYLSLLSIYFKPKNRFLKIS